MYDNVQHDHTIMRLVFLNGSFDSCFNREGTFESNF